MLGFSVDLHAFPKDFNRTGIIVSHQAEHYNVGIMTS